MFSAEDKPGHEDDDDGVPEIDRVGETCNDLKYMIIEPLSYISGVRNDEYE